jgi:hypothetical protein
MVSIGRTDGWLDDWVDLFWFAIIDDHFLFTTTTTTTSITATTTSVYHGRGFGSFMM